jgi:SSS family solute:Na+ symporter
MRPLDWVVLFGWLAFLVGYGIYRGRGSNTVSQFLLAGKTMPWYAMGLSIMATQASAITFISTTAQSYVDGMRFVQFYLGLPIAMVILSATAVPIFHRAKVYTAYEYLEGRFDAKTRLLVTIVFLIQRGLAAGLGLSAPAIVMSVILGWPFRVTIVLMGGLVVLFTTMGGIKAVTWADVLQMAVIMSALVLALVLCVHSMPRDVSFFDAIKLAGAAGRLNAITTAFDWNDRFNLWSGLIGGSFLALAYFGTDQSQVQRYLAGRSVGQSRLSLLFNAMAKVPVQFFILFIGTMVFVFFLFERPPLVFQPAELARIQATPQYAAIEAGYEQAFDQRRTAARGLKDAGDDAARANALGAFQSAQADLDRARKSALALTGDDTNYIFLSFVTHYLPVGLVGLVVAVIFTAAMVSISGEINALATVTLIDIYRRYLHKEGTDTHYLGFSRWATVFWGLYAVVFASSARGFGALIVAVNQVGSLFYGGMLGVFVLAFFVKRVGARGAFIGVLAGEAAIFAAAHFTDIAFLWYNVIGSVVVVLVGLAVPEKRKRLQVL